MAATKKTEYTLEQVAQANTPKKLWIVLHGKVYDVSRYSDDHPGGRDVLMELAGTDASSDFDFVGHSKSAIRSLDEFEVGSLRGYSVAPKRKARQLVQQLERPFSSSKRRLSARMCIGILILLLPPSLSYAVGKIAPFIRGWSGTAPSEQFILASIISLAVIVGVLIIIGRNFWNRMFHYKDVFAYAPYYTLS